MNINIKSKKVFGILGLPRMGTTLVNNIMNSYDNSFCISEPHWSNILSPQATRSDKVTFDIKDNNKIMTNLSNFVSNSGVYQLGGVKETYRSHQMESANFVLNSDNVDFIIAVIRKPEFGFDAWLRSNWRGYYIDVNNYINTVKHFYKTLDNSDKQVFWLQYETLCADGYSYLNKVFDGHLVFDELNNIKKTNFIFGDPTANTGGSIKPPKNSLFKVNENQANLIREKLDDLYDKHTLS
jgi:hypothetical protein